MLQSKIDCQYLRHTGARICQGDILRDFAFAIAEDGQTLRELNFPYITVLSQDCDLEQASKLQPACDGDNEPREFNQFMPCVLFTPAYPFEEVRSGDHLIQVFDIKPARIGGEQKKMLRKNKIDRYHYFCSNVEMQVPELVIDFKNYFTLSFEYFLSLYKDSYFVTINELFRERLSQRFGNYLNRIGLPEIDAQPLDRVTT